MNWSSMDQTWSKHLAKFNGTSIYSSGGKWSEHIDPDRRINEWMDGWKIQASWSRWLQLLSWMQASRWPLRCHRALRLLLTQAFASTSFIIATRCCLAHSLHSMWAGTSSRLRDWCMASSTWTSALSRWKGNLGGFPHTHPCGPQQHTAVQVTATWLCVATRSGECAGCAPQALCAIDRGSDERLSRILNFQRYWYSQFSVFFVEIAIFYLLQDDYR